VIPNCGGSLDEHRFGRPDEVHRWRLHHARRARELSVQRVSDTVFTVVHTPEGAPPITLGTALEHPEWEPGLYTAAEVIETVNGILATEAQLVDETVERFAGGL
jgi:hypothetical protein